MEPVKSSQRERESFEVIVLIAQGHDREGVAVRERNEKDKGEP